MYQNKSLRCSSVSRPRHLASAPAFYHTSFSASPSITPSCCFPFFCALSRLFSPRLLPQTVLCLLFTLILYSFHDSLMESLCLSSSLAMRGSLWVFSRSQWETAVYQPCRKSGQQQPHLPPPSPLLAWVHALEHAALNMSLCSLWVAYTSLSDVCALWSKGFWPWSQSCLPLGPLWSKRSCKASG